jgi:carbamoyl-phosphate synthase small subunit
VRPALLALADGQLFEGEAVGDLAPVVTGELVFNTALSGYQEVITDPSYAGQVVAFTYPHIGNYGTTAQDDESGRPQCAGVVVRDLVAEPSNWRSTEGLAAWMARHGLPAISGIDTRRLTRHLRQAGAMPCAFGTAGADELAAAAAAAPGTDGRDLVSGVTTAAPYGRGDGPLRVVAYDFGVKETMLRHLGRLATVTVVPASTPAAEVLAMDPEGVFLSNGPGDPGALDAPTAAVADLVGRVPIFGICLGHQLMGLACGGKTYKLKFGHRGANHPVLNQLTGKVEITSHNHGFAVDPDSLKASEVEFTHVNLNDQTLEGFRHRNYPAFCVQYHPEAAPGPHDSLYLFDDFVKLMNDHKGGAR